MPTVNNPTDNTLTSTDLGLIAPPGDSEITDEQAEALKGHTVLRVLAEAAPADPPTDPPPAPTIEGTTP